MQAAINALGSDPGPHELLLKVGTLAIPNGVNISLPAQDIRISGGYAACASLNQLPGERTVVDAAGGAQGTAINIDAGDRAVQQLIRFRQVEIRGGDSETGPFANPEGGGLEIRGHVRVQLETGALVNHNSSGRGGGVYLRGQSVSRPAELVIRLAAEIRDNSASTRGGGIYCDDHGMITLEYGQIAFNQAATGGGVDLRQGCSLLSPAPSSSSLGVNGFFFNQATISGGAIFAAPNGTRHPTLHLVGATGNPGNPLLFFNNTAPRGAGIQLENAHSSTASVYLANTIWSGQQASATSAPGVDFRAAVINTSGSVNLEIEAWENCRISFFGVSGCSGFYDNAAASGAGVIAVPGAQSEVTILRTRIEGNSGDPAVLLSMGTSTHIESTIIRDNTSVNQIEFLPARHTLMTVSTEGDHRLRYSTVLSNFQLDYLVTATTSVNPALPAGFIDLSGSILWAPGTQLVRNNPSRPSSIRHYQCLLTHNTTGIPAVGVIVANPLLRADLSPGDNSPALDICDKVPGAPLPDFFGHPRGVDQLAVPNLWGPHDLGAIERTDQVMPQPDQIFSDAFQ